MQMAILKNTLVKLYNSFSIDWNTDVSKLKPQYFSTFKDLYDLILEEFKMTKNNTLSEISILLVDIAIGSDSFIWNGNTTVEDNSNFICFDTNKNQGLVQLGAKDGKMNTYYITELGIQILNKF